MRLNPVTLLAGPPRAGLLAHGALALAAASFAPSAAAADCHWVGTWVSTQQLVEPANLPPAPGLAHASLRQVIQPSLDGAEVRMTFSNAYGEEPLVLAGVTIANSTGGAGIATDSLRAVTFAGRADLTLAPGAIATSDTIPFPVRAFDNLAVTVCCAALPAKVTGHPGSRTTSYLLAGDQLADAAFAGAATTDHWYLLAAVDVCAEPAAAAIVVIGDSITDGRGSITNHNNRWPNLLGRRLRADPRTAHLSVLNQGLGANRVVHPGVGPAAVDRFERDALTPAGVRWVVIFEGVNDIGTAVRTGAPAAPELIRSYADMVSRARARGLKVIGATIMPFAGFSSYSTPASEADRQAVNAWIRTPGHFDGVIDFDAITRDPADPTRLLAAVDGGDHLHPSAAGYQLMADAIDLNLFTGEAK